ncbi:MAG: NDP-sugar synthase, partial [Dehalococcoidia bacterium]
MYALILAGGRGERLWPLTEEIPKPMVEVLGKPILWHQLTWLRSYGVTHVVLLVHHRWEHIRQYFGDGEALGLQVCYSVEETPLGRGGALRRGLS